MTHSYRRKEIMFSSINNQAKQKSPKIVTCEARIHSIQECPRTSTVNDKLVFLFSFSFVDGMEIRKDFHVIDICLITTFGALTSWMGCEVWGEVSEDTGAPPSCASGAAAAAASAFIKSLKLSRSFSQMSNWSQRSPRGFRGFFLISWWPSIFVLERRLSNSKAGKQRCKICRNW